MPGGWAKGPNIRDERPTSVRRARLQAAASGKRAPTAKRRRR